MPTGKKTSAHSSPQDTSAAREIDAIISMAGDWRGETLARLRAVIRPADPAVVEAVTWK